VLVTALVEALDDQLLVVSTAEDGTDTIVAGENVEQLLLDVSGGNGRAAAVKHAAVIAERHSLPRHRAFAVVAGDALLVALVAHAARQPA
jgi:hypothetical protein